MFFMFSFNKMSSKIMYKVAPLLREYPINHSRIMYNIKPVQTVGETNTMSSTGADNQQLQGSFKLKVKV